MPEGLPASYRWVSSESGRHLRGRPKSGTVPERLLRSELHRRGLRFRVAKRLKKGCTPDVVFVSARVAVFIDGCFWHACPIHGRRTFGGPNATLWTAKLARNRRTDQRANDIAEEAGYAVIRVWECEVRADLMATAARVVELVAAGRGQSRRKKSTAVRTASKPAAVTVEPRDS